MAVLYLAKYWILSHNSRHWLATRMDRISLRTFSRLRCSTSIAICITQQRPSLNGGKLSKELHTWLGH